MLRAYDTKAALALPHSYTPKKRDAISDSNQKIHKNLLLSPSRNQNENSLSMHSLSRYGSRHDSMEDLISLNIEELHTPRKNNDTPTTLDLVSKNSDFKSSEKNSFGLSPLIYNQKSATKQERFVAIHMMSEDHKLSLERERKRITKKTDGIWHPLPSDASAVYLPRYARTAPPQAPMKHRDSIGFEPIKNKLRLRVNGSMTSDSQSPELSSHSTEAGSKLDTPSRKIVLTAPIVLSPVLSPSTFRQRLSSFGKGIYVY